MSNTPAVGPVDDLQYDGTVVQDSVNDDNLSDRIEGIGGGPIPLPARTSQTRLIATCELKNHLSELIHAFAGQVSILCDIAFSDPSCPMAGTRLGTFVPTLPNTQHAGIAPDGHWRGSDRAGDHLVYVVLTNDGSQETYAPRRFREKVRLEEGSGDGQLPRRLKPQQRTVGSTYRPFGITGARANGPFSASDSDAAASTDPAGSP